MSISVIFIVVVLVVVYRFVIVGGKDKKKEPTVFELDVEVFQKQLLAELNVEVYQRKDNYYQVGFQGGVFGISFWQNNKFIRLTYDRFYNLKHEQSLLALAVENEINRDSAMWTCFHTENRDAESEYPLSVWLRYMYLPQGNMAQVIAAVRYLLTEAFDVSRKFESMLQEKLKENVSLEEGVVAGDFYHKLSYLRHRRETYHTHTDLGEEWPGANKMTVSALISNFSETEFGRLKDMKLIAGNKVEQFTDENQIMNFNLHEFIYNHHNSLELEAITLRVCFERQDLIVDLRKANGCTDKTLFYIINVMRTSTELDHAQTHAHGMVEIRLTTENEDYWEAKYMVDEALDKYNSGGMDCLTLEQRMIVNCAEPSLHTGMYWAMKYFNKSCYHQSLFYFRRLLVNLDVRGNRENGDWYYNICLFVGLIYMQLNMIDRAHYYLQIAQESGDYNAIKEFMDCMCIIQNHHAMEYITDIRKRVEDTLRASDGQHDEALEDLYRHTNRRLINLLIDKRDLDRAEHILNEMIENEYDVEYAKGELKRVENLRNGKS